MQLTPAQSKILKDNHRFRIVNCGRRLGKTTGAVLEMIYCACAKADKKIAYIANTYQQARDIAWELLKKYAPTININETRLEIKVKTQDGGQSEIVLRGWENIETLRGQHFDFLVLDEVAQMKNFWLHWHEALRPTLTDTKGSCLFLSTPKGFNHFYDLYNIEAEDKDYKSFHFTTYDNPHIPKEEVDKAREELPEDRFAQEYMADFRKQEGLVYKEFDRQTHLYDDTIDRAVLINEILLAVDFGYTNPTAVLTIEKDHRGDYWVRDEWYKTGKTNIEIIEYCKSKKSNVVYPDPAEPDRIDEMRKHGLNIREVSKDVEAGIDKLRELFKANRLHVHRRCTNLINELETYAYDAQKKDGKNLKEAPIKENDHALDALRYALFMNSGVVRRTKGQRAHIPQWQGYTKK